MATKVEYHRLGNSGLRVSVPVLGGMTFGDPNWIPWVVSKEKGLELLKAAWDVGINTIDTANIYSNGESESIIAEFMQKNQIPRENLVIMTKAFFPVSPGSSVYTMFDPATANKQEFINLGGLSRTALFNQVEGSLRRLKTTYIDLLQIHLPDPATPMEETMRALHDLVVSGKVRYIGACNIRVWQFAEMNHIAESKGWTTFTSVQFEHSLLYRAEEKEMLAYCNFKGIGVLSYSPLMDGHLARPLGTETPRTKNINGTFLEKKRRDSDKVIIKRVEELAAKHSVKMGQVALAWASLKVSSPIVGANTPQRVLESVVTGITLSQEEIKYLEEPYEHQPTRM